MLENIDPKCSYEQSGRCSRIGKWECRIPGAAEDAKQYGKEREHVRVLDGICWSSVVRYQLMNFYINVHWHIIVCGSPWPMSRRSIFFVLSLYLMHACDPFLITHQQYKRF